MVAGELVIEGTAKKLGRVERYAAGQGVSVGERRGVVLAGRLSALAG